MYVCLPCPRLFTTIKRDGALRFLRLGAAGNEQVPSPWRVLCITVVMRAGHHERPGRSPRPSGIDSSASSRHALHLLLSRWCSHRPPPHSLQRLLLRLCSQMLDPAHSRHAPNALMVADAPAAALRAPAPDALVLAEAPAPALPAHAPDAPGRTDARSPALLAPLPPVLLNALSFACMQMPGCSC